MTAPAHALTDDDVARIRRRSRVAIIAGQALAGIGMGATFSAGALLATQLSGSEAFSGTSVTLSTLGAAAAAVPLARLAQRRGRSPALATGSGIAALGAVVGLVASGLGSFPIFLVAMGMLGVGTAVNLQSRFAGTDLSDPKTRGRDLAIVVWSTTIGAVAGPNLIGPGDALGQAVGLPALSGVFFFALAAQLVAFTVYLVLLRPDPLLTAIRLGVERGTAAIVARAEDRGGVVTG
ncbi:MFS transporter, partial [Pseudolysinimonas sp.]